MWVPNVQDIHGIELATGYEELPPTGEIFDNKALAVMGLGNAGFESGIADCIFRNVAMLTCLKRMFGPLWQPMLLKTMRSTPICGRRDRTVSE